MVAKYLPEHHISNTAYELYYYKNVGANNGHLNCAYRTKLCIIWSSNANAH